MTYPNQAHVQTLALEFLAWIEQRPAPTSLNCARNGDGAPYDWIVRCSALETNKEPFYLSGPELPALLSGLICLDPRNPADAYAARFSYPAPRPDTKEASDNA